MSELHSLSKLRILREMMKLRDLDAYVVPSEDAHSSEYLAPCDARRAYITSFTGSAGCAVITRDKALCWTDGRYWLQATKQLGDGWSLMKSGLPEVPTWSKWLANLPSSRVGIDPNLLSFSEIQNLSHTFRQAQSRTPSILVPVKENLIDLIWSSSQPPRPSNEVFHLGDEFTGETIGSKLSLLRDKLLKAGSPGMVITNLDEIAWMFNLRGSDIPYNPVFFAYATLTPYDCTLFIHPSALNTSVREYLHINNIAVLGYSHVWSALESWGKLLEAQRESPKPPGTPLKRYRDEAETGEKKKEDTIAEEIAKTDKVLIGTKTSWAVARAVGEDKVEVRRSMVEDAKAKKNATEIEGFRQSHIRDGVALVRYFAWLEDVLQKGEQWTEYAAAEVLASYRKENKWFKGLSFDTISSTGANAAIIHYSPPAEGSAIIDRNQMYLCDSGAQYLDGTTDTTRTLHFGQPTAEEKRAFTRVLQGHIALDAVVFPQGTTGYVLDVLARKALWADGLDYRHSTSHGVGAFLNVHEGPQGVGQRPAYNETALQAGMVMSNEPGYYADGKFGIRIENIVVIKMAETKSNFGGKGYLELEHVTMCPIQTSLIELDLLLPPEKDWLNSYHAEILDKLLTLLIENGDTRAVEWLRRACEPV